MKYFITLLTVVFLAGTIVHVPTMSYAQNSAECSKTDIKRIKSFNNKIKRKQKDYNRAMEKAEKMKTVSDVNRLRKKISMIEAFFNSSEYINMREVYDRCNISMPGLND